jgi:hypothetical protein
VKKQPVLLRNSVSFQRFEHQPLTLDLLALSSQVLALSTTEPIKKILKVAVFSVEPMELCG